ncbi:hypothetical protein D3C73_1257220 [compost metagenome]
MIFRAVLIVHDLFAGEHDIVEIAIFIGQDRLLSVFDNLIIQAVQLNAVSSKIIRVLFKKKCSSANFPGFHFKRTVS